MRFTVDNKFRRALDLSFGALHVLKETADSLQSCSRHEVMEDLGFWEKGGNQLDGPVKNVEVEQSMKFLNGLTNKSKMKPTNLVLDDSALIC